MHFFIGSFFILLLANKPFIVTLLDKKKEHFDKEEKEKKNINKKEKGLDHANLSSLQKEQKKYVKKYSRRLSYSYYYIPGILRIEL